MNFKITKNAISKRKYRPIYTIIFAIILVSLILFLHFYKKEEIDWLQVIIFSPLIPIATIISILGAYRDIKELKQLTLEIKKDGIYLYAPAGISIIPFDIVQSVKLKYKNNKIKKFIVKSNSGRIDNYSDFENLNELNNKLKKYLDLEKWK